MPKQKVDEIIIINTINGKSVPMMQKVRTGEKYFIGYEN